MLNEKNLYTRDNYGRARNLVFLLGALFVITLGIIYISFQFALNPSFDATLAVSAFQWLDFENLWLCATVVEILVLIGVIRW
ncbi:MAG: hypothetical protein AAF570_12080 [Bacteroidota bacterium]